MKRLLWLGLSLSLLASSGLPALAYPTAGGGHAAGAPVPTSTGGPKTTTSSSGAKTSAGTPGTGAKGHTSAHAHRGPHGNRNGYTSAYYYGPYPPTQGSSVDNPNKKPKRKSDEGVIPTYNKAPMQGKETNSQARSSKIPGLVDKPNP